MTVTVTHSSVARVKSREKNAAHFLHWTHLFPPELYRDSTIKKNFQRFSWLQVFVKYREVCAFAKL